MGCPYVYQPLVSPDQVRLVKLLPGTEDEPLQLELHTYLLAEAPPFDALTYNRRSRKPDCNVICDGCELPVVPETYHILRSLRCARASRLLWTDHISMNQNDWNERTSYIQMLGQINHTAVRTLVCVPHDNIQSLKDFVKYTQQLDQYRRAEMHFSQAKDIFRSASRITYQDLQEFEESVPQTKHGFDTSGVKELLENPLFSRYSQASYVCNR